MKTIHSLVSLLIIFYIVQCVKDPVAIKTEDYPSDHDSIVVDLDNNNFGEMIFVEGRIAMVEFYKPTCESCKEMIDIVDSLAKTFHRTALIGKVDVNENDSLSDAFDIFGVPTFIFFRSGDEYNRVRTTSFDSLAALIQSGFDSEVETLWF